MTKAAELAKIGEVATNSQIGGRRNIVINGAMQVAQRATSATGLGTQNNYFTLDRWKATINSAGRFTMSQTADGPVGFANCMKLDCTTADASIAAGEYLIMEHHLEGQDVQAIGKGVTGAKEVTLSFYVKANAAFDFVAELHDQDNGRTNGRVFSTTTDWVRHEITFQADVDDGSSPFDDDNANSLSIKFWLHAGTTYSGGTLASSWENITQANRAAGIDSFFSSTDNNFFITGVQMEVGSVATPFENRSFGEEIILCQRYFRLSNDGSSAYQAVGNAVGYAETTSSFTAFWTWETEMRATPTLAIFNEGVSAGSVIVRQDNSYFCDGVALGVGGKKGLLINLTTPDNTGGDTTFQDGVPGGVYTSTNNIAWSIDAEL